MKKGDIIENYQGRFAKIVDVKDSLFGVSAFVMTREKAEEETAVDVFLNEFGLAQIMKEGAEGMGDAEKPLSKLTVDELKAIATEMGIPAEGKKAELVAAIEAKRAEGMGDAD